MGIVFFTVNYGRFVECTLNVADGRVGMYGKTENYASVCLWLLIVSGLVLSC